MLPILRLLPFKHLQKLPEQSMVKNTSRSGKASILPTQQPLTRNWNDRATYY